MLEVSETQALAVSFRLKRFDTIVDKLVRGSVKLPDLADIGGVRVVVNTQVEAVELVELLTEALEVRRHLDLVAQPRGSGYRALHLHVRQARRTVEVQVRTFGQDAWANAVEKESRYSGLDYKSGQGHPQVLQFFRLLAELIGAAEGGVVEQGVAPDLEHAFRAAKPLLRSPVFAKLDP